MIERQLNPDWYRVKYNLAALNADWGIVEGDNQGDRFKDARAGARDVAIKGLQVMIARPKEAGDALLEFLERIVPAAISLYAETARVVSPPGPAGTVLRREEVLARLERGDLSSLDALHYVLNLKDLSARVLYNVACARVRMGEPREAAATLTAAFEKASLSDRTYLAEQAGPDPSLKALWATGDFTELKAKIDGWAKPAPPPTPAPAPPPADPPKI